MAHQQIYSPSPTNYSKNNNATNNANNQYQQQHWNGSGAVSVSPQQTNQYAYSRQHQQQQRLISYNQYNNNHCNFDVSVPLFVNLAETVAICMCDVLVR